MPDLNNKAKLLFFVFGPSNHAPRRVGLFCESPEFDVTVVSNYDYGFKNADNVVLLQVSKFRNKVLRLFLRNVAPLFDLARIIRTLRSNSFDMIFFQTLLYPSYLGLAFVKRGFMLTFWNGDILWESRGTLVEKVLKTGIVRYALRNAAAITVNSEVARRAIVAKGGDGSKIHIIRYPGNDSHLFCPGSRRAARLSVNIDSKVKLVLCTRSLAPIYNTDSILRIIPKVVLSVPHCKFVFAWSSASGRDLKRHLGLIEQLRIGDYINGYVVGLDDAESIASAVIKACDPKNRKNDIFKTYNLDFVRREFDSDLNERRIKDLVKQVGEWRNHN